MPRKKKNCPGCGKIIQGASKYCRSCAHLGARHNLWKGGRYLDGGYVYKHMPSHPHSTRKGYIYEHILVMEKKLGRLLQGQEEIHHLNGIKNDNRIENLYLCNNHSEHLKLFHKPPIHKHTTAEKKQISLSLRRDLDFVNKEWLEKEYQQKSALTISKELGKSYNWVRKRILEFGIKIEWRRRK